MSVRNESRICTLGIEADIERFEVLRVVNKLKFPLSGLLFGEQIIE